MTTESSSQDASLVSLQEVERSGFDLLTGLRDRAGLYKSLTTTLAAAQDRGIEPALLALDLDRFQVINDSTGIATGDGVLVRVARRIVGAIPKDATVARISGDEFAVLLPDGRTAEATANWLLELIGRPYVVNGHAVTLSVSIGLALVEHGKDADAILREANIALHLAEAQGKNQVRVFVPEMQERASSRQLLETDFRAAIALNKAELRTAAVVDQFEVHYQPQFQIDTRELLGFEALVRWRHPLRGMVGPNDFIPLAEEIGLIGLLGDWVMHSACRAAASWPIPRHGKPLQVAVNVSTIQLRERGALVAGIANALMQSGLHPGRLEVEITESGLIGDGLETLKAIKALGVSLSLDDFGTGYSSLSQLTQFPFDRLKIDRSFVRDLPTGQDCDSTHQRHASLMIQAIASLGAGLGMSTIAEGVETEFQAELVRQAGINMIQGFLLGRPTPDGEVVAMINRLDESVRICQST